MRVEEQSAFRQPERSPRSKRARSAQNRARVARFARLVQFAACAIDAAGRRGVLHSRVTRLEHSSTVARCSDPSHDSFYPRYDSARRHMIRKLKNGRYRIYSRSKKNGKRRNLGTFDSLAAAKKHERAIQFFKRA
jgi:hypothetical protein